MFSQAKPSFSSLQKLYSKSWSHLPLKLSKIIFSITKLSLIYIHEHRSPIHFASCLRPGRGMDLGCGRQQARPGDQGHSSGPGGESCGTQSRERPLARATSLPSPCNSPATLLADMVFIPISQMRTVRLREAVSCSGQRDLCVAEPGQAQVVWPSILGSRR